MNSASNGTYTISPSEAASNTITVRVSRVRAYQRMAQGAVIACAIGWHDHESRCDAKSYADLLHTPEEEWT